MDIAAGARIGRFEILGSLGAGGMGEVYRARDHQLQRDVAIKILPQAFAADPDRRRRFEQEARAAAGLSHPNILAVHDAGVHGASAYIVTELLEGETLRARMAGRPLPVRKAIDFAIQIASGLAAGHDRRIIHRDIKPDNIFVTTDGRVKILDFGLAKLAESDSGDTETIAVDGEGRGQVIGTAAYMSPEQARGQHVDHRTDIFSLGVVIHEMLSGASPFRRDTTTDTVSAVLHDDPPSLTAANVSPGLERLVLHCLEKKPDERFQNVRDLTFDLQTRADATSGRVTAGRRRRMPRQLAAWLVATAALVAAGWIGYLVATWRTPPPALPHVRSLTNLAGLEEFSAISPDGKQVAYTATEATGRQIFVRQVAGSPALQVTHDEADHQHVRWLPDGSSLIYFSPAGPGEVQGAIRRVSSFGGDTTKVTDSIDGGDVSRQGRLACFKLANGRIQLVTTAIDGAATAQVVHEFAPPIKYYRYPRWSPDGQWIAFQTGDGFRWDIYYVPARGGAPVALTREEKMMRGLAWRPDSKAVVYSTSGGTTIPYLPPLGLWEVRLNAPFETRQLTPAEGWYEEPDVHASGLVSVTRMRMQFDVWSYPVDGDPKANVQRANRITHQTGQVLTPTANPHSDEVAYLADSGGHSNIWVTSKQGQARQITKENDPAVAIGVPIWSPDGRSIGYVSSSGNVGFRFGLWLVKPDGSDARRLVPRGLGMAWSPDSRFVYYVESSTSGVIKRIAVDDGATVDIPSDPVRNIVAADEAFVYYLVERALVDGRPQFEIKKTSLTSGQTTLLFTFPVSQVASWQVVNPTLSPDSKWLAVLLTDGFTTNIWRVSTEDGRKIQVTDFADRAIFIVRRVSWSADGKSILAAVGEGDTDVVLLDGVAGLKR